MGRYNNLIKCAQVRKLIEENKYTKALEIIEELDLRRIHSFSDLNLFAEVYKMADRYDDAKEIYFGIYEKTGSKRALYRLIMLELRTGNRKKARELFLEYEMAAGVTLDTYELRYRMAKAEGAKTSELIHILEDLRKEEFTEKWGYELACLHYKKGNKEACTNVCKDLVLWFATGDIVEKAKKLIEQCEMEDLPELAEELVEEIQLGQEEVSIPFASMPVQVTEMDELPAQEQDEESVQEPEAVEQEETEVEPEPIPQHEEEVAEEPEAKEEEEENIFVSDNGIYYFTVKDTMGKIQKLKGPANFVITGGEGTITLAFAKKIIKALEGFGAFTVDKTRVAKISADKLNRVDLDEKIQRLLGGCMIILDAQDMTPETAQNVERVMDQYGQKMVIILIGNFEELDCWFTYHKELEKKIAYKVKL